MKTDIKQTDLILLTGKANLIAGVAICLLNAGHHVDVCADDKVKFDDLIREHLASPERIAENNDFKHLKTVSKIPANRNYKLAVALTGEDVHEKQALIHKLETVLSAEAIIAINTESIPLDSLQNSVNKQRLIGLNWTEPAYTTFFLEIISGENNADAVDSICEAAKLLWGKDPYIVKNSGIRSRLISAMAREASFLVDNGYASVDDIDRACRNDAGYYLPFAGNCRYMDLMGTYAYGMVMKDLNPDLSKSQQLPGFMERILDEGGLGMENKTGFYTYTDDAVDNWKRTMDKFSYQIRNIIEKYPFNYIEEIAID